MPDFRFDEKLEKKLGKNHDGNKMNEIDNWEMEKVWKVPNIYLIFLPLNRAEIRKATNESTHFPFSEANRLVLKALTFLFTAAEKMSHCWSYNSVDFLSHISVNEKQLKAESGYRTTQKLSFTRKYQKQLLINSH